MKLVIYIYIYIYIQKAAEILNKYWPKEVVVLNSDGTESISYTGHCVYRVGGDEFILLTSIEKLQLALIKADLAATEAQLIKLGIEDDVPIGFNYGVVNHAPGDLIKQTFVKADMLMQEDKKKMYVKHNLERRGR